MINILYHSIYLCNNTLSLLGSFTDGTYEAPRAKRRDWAFFEKSDKLIEIDPNEFGLDAVLFWASGTQ